MPNEVTVDAPSRALELITCPECSAIVREEKFRNHMQKVHGSEVPSEYRIRHLEIIRCPICPTRMREDRLRKHMKKVHPECKEASQARAENMRTVQPIKNPPIGLQVLADIERNIHWNATHIEACTTCKRRIVFLDVAKSTVKAFDVDRNRRILGTHSCEERSASIYAYSAGIVDSNRRRH